MKGVKTCPFCGGKAKLIDATEVANTGAVVVECQKCGASGPLVYGVKEDPKPHAREAWNRRTLTQQIHSGAVPPKNPNRKRTSSVLRLIGGD